MPIPLAGNRNAMSAAQEFRPAQSLPPEPAPGRLAEIFFAHGGNISDKWEQYLPIYESELARFLAAGAPVRLLEIGVQNGGSLQVWSRYLPPGSSITGMDIDPACGRLDLGAGIRVLVGNAAEPKVLDRLLGDAVFDVIVDDGSHRSADIIRTFEACFPRLAPGGTYIIEDVHCSYFASHAGGFRTPGAAMEYFKAIADAPNADHFEADAAAGGAAELARLRALNTELARISFLDSVITLQKLPAPKRAPYRRIMGGRTSPVADAAFTLRHLPVPLLRSLLLSPTAAETFAAPLATALAEARAETVAAQARADRLEAELDVRRAAETAAAAEVPPPDMLDTLAAAKNRAAAAEAALEALRASTSMRLAEKLAGLTPAPLRRLAGALLRR